MSEASPGAHSGMAADHRTMNRREAVRLVALLMGGAMAGYGVLLGGQEAPGRGSAEGFTGADRALLDEIGDTIVPATDIPGAKSVGIGAFMAMMVTDCYDEKEHAVFRRGLVQINEACRAMHGTSFMDSTAAQRAALADALDAEQRADGEKKGEGAPSHYFRMMKELTLLGYFSSEVGCTRAVRYIEVPGAYHGDVPYKRGDRAWY